MEAEKVHEFWKYGSFKYRARSRIPVASKMEIFAEKLIEAVTYFRKDRHFLCYELPELTSKQKRRG